MSNTPGGTDALKNATNVATWLSVSEESLFITDGIIYLKDLLRPPENSESRAQFDREIQKLLALESDPEQLSDKIGEICRSQSNVCSQLTSYRLSALLSIWGTRELLLKKQETHAKNVALARRSQSPAPETALFLQEDFTKTLALKLLFPLIQSQAKTDPQLAISSNELLMGSLASCAPLSLTDNSLDGLLDLLRQWIHTSVTDKSSPIPLAKVVCTLVAFTYTRKSVSTMIQSIDIMRGLQKTLGATLLPVADMLAKLKRLEGGKCEPLVLSSSNHSLCWAYDDRLEIKHKPPPVEPPEAPAGQPDHKFSSSSEKHSMASDGKYIYLTNVDGCGASKLGSGFDSTLRGFVYAKNEELDSGFLAHANGLLIYRSKLFDLEDGTNTLVKVLDKENLQVLETLDMPDFLKVPAFTNTIQLISNGFRFFWVRSYEVPEALRPHVGAGYILFVDTFKICPVSKMVSPDQPRVFLERRDANHIPSKSDIYEQLLNNNTEGITAQETVTGADALSTTVRVNINWIVRAPMWTCGNFLVILFSQNILITEAQRGPMPLLYRTVFGIPTGGTHLAKVLGTSAVFSLRSGNFEVGNPKSNVAKTVSGVLNKQLYLTGLLTILDLQYSFLSTF